MPGEPFLVTIGNDVTAAAGATLLTHDNSVIKCNLNATDYFGRITIGNSCFIGMNSILLPGVELGERTIVGAGSVVTKSFPEGNVVVAGNPARVICTVEEFRAKQQHLCVNLDEGDRRARKREYLLSLPEEMFEKKYLPEYFDKYVYLVGDLADDILRLKGFALDSKSPNYFHYIPEYITESCAYNCKYYVLKRVREKDKK